jgi:hypothetical protein
MQVQTENASCVKGNLCQIMHSVQPLIMPRTVSTSEFVHMLLLITCQEVWLVECVHVPLVLLGACVSANVRLNVQGGLDSETPLSA